MRPLKTAVATACLPAAVTAREATISTALGTVVVAIKKRNTAVAAVKKNTDLKAKNAAIKAANAALAATWKTFHAARALAWSQYKTAALAC